MWRFGIPDFIGNYVYFQDLNNTSNNCYAAQLYKQNLAKKATATMVRATKGITDTGKIAKANKFLSSVAQNERDKEIRMIESFCKQTGAQFPSLQQYLNNPKKIEKDPQAFYVELTNAINVARRGTTEYLNELKRIQRNLQEKGRDLSNYKADDYRYRLVGDISSFLNRLRGNYKDIADTDQYSLKVQNMVMNILSSTGLTAAITSGEDFAAIAASTLADVEKQVQKEMDKLLDDPSQNRDLVTIIDDVADKIEKEYISKINKRDKMMSPVQRAIADINGLDYAKITQNAKELLGIKSFNLEDEAFKKYQKKINSKENLTVNQKIKSIRNNLSVNKLLKDNLSLIKFSISGSVNTKHGSIYELVESTIGNALTSGRNVSGKAAIDIITYSIRYDVAVDDSAMSNLLSSMAEAISDSTFEDEDTPSNIRSVKEQLATMNKKIAQAIDTAEQQLKGLKKFNVDEIFVYHETLKLYSSVETGKNPHNSFGGRDMGILKYIDYMASSQVNGVDLAATPEDLAFLGLNLTPGAMADTAVGPLEKYFSMYASLLMFDDITNMAIEAVTQVDKSQKTNRIGITQIHLYNLNGIYVPASMLLSFVSDTVTEAGAMVEDGLAAKAHITVPKQNDAYNAWLARKAAGNGRLYRSDWEAVAQEAASKTKVSITFLASFLAFVGKLGGI